MSDLPITNKGMEVSIQEQFKRSSSIYINDKVVDNVFNREGIQNGYTYNIGYDSLSITLDKSNNKNAVSQIQYLDDYDRSVYDAICTLYNHLTVELKAKRVKERIKLQEKGIPAETIESLLSAPEYINPIFSVKHIYQIMVGETSSTIHPSDDTFTRIEESLDKLCSMRISISLYDSDNQKPKSQHTNNILFLGKHEMPQKVPAKDNSGNIYMEEKMMTYYMLYEMPVLYDYAANNNMVSVLPIEKVKTVSIKMTKMNLILTSKLRNKVLNGKQTILIDFEELYNYFYEDELSESTFLKRKQRIRENTIKILNDWKETKFIDDWEIAEYGKRKIPLSILVRNSNNYHYEHMLSQFIELNHTEEEE